MIKFSIEYAKKYGMDELENKALSFLRQSYIGNWDDAEVIADVIDGDVIFKVMK